MPQAEVVIQPAPQALRARAVTGRQCPHSGRREDFLSRQPDFFTETAVTPERKVEKWLYLAGHLFTLFLSKFKVAKKIFVPG